MLRYKNLGTTISIDLHNGYEIIVMANWNRQTEKYDVELYLNMVEVDMLLKIDEDIQIESDRREIKTQLSQYVTTCLSSGAFSKPIELYEYHMECFSIGEGRLKMGGEEHD